MIICKYISSKQRKIHLAWQKHVIKYHLFMYVLYNKVKNNNNNLNRVFMDAYQGCIAVNKTPAILDM